MGVLDAWAYGIPCVVTPVGKNLLYSLLLKRSELLENKQKTV